MPRTPFLSQADVLEIKRSTIAQKNLEKAKKRMIEFYKSNSHWLIKQNHNHLRITRILKSIKLLVSQSESEKIYKVIINFLNTNDKTALEKSILFWQEAIQN